MPAALDVDRHPRIKSGAGSEAAASFDRHRHPEEPAKRASRRTTVTAQDESGPRRMSGRGRAVAPGSSPGQALRGSPGSSPGSRAPQGDGNESVRNALAISLLSPRRSRAHPRHETSRRRNPAVGDDDLAGDEARGGRGEEGRDPPD